MVREYRYTGPDGEGVPELPPGTGAAIGSEYCVHLLPGVGELEKAILLARDRRAPLLLLTPYFRDAELKKSMALFRAIPEGADVLVAVNDWGALLALRALFPRLPLSVGRLLSGQKRCPRIAGSPFLTEKGRAWYGEGLFSSPRARRYLREEFGVVGFHADVLAWGSPVPEAPADGEPAFFLYLHGPYSIVTVSDACSWIGGISSSAIPSCPRPCRNGSVVLREGSMGREMIGKGKAKFVETSPPSPSAPRDRPSAISVLYEEVP
jgi:hypothetical protein